MTAHPSQPSPELRLSVVMVVVGGLFVALVARLWFLQVIDAPKAQAVAAANGVQLIYTPAPRGEILDRNGVVLAGDVNQPVIEVSRQAASQNPAMVTRLAPLLGMTVPELLQAINNQQYSPYAPVPVMANPSPSQILYVQEHQALFPGVTATTTSVRTYPYGEAVANIIGYVGLITPSLYQKLKGQGYQPSSQIGLQGVEETLEGVLRGVPGVRRVQVNSKGEVLGTLDQTPPVPGDNVRLTIDINVQKVAIQALLQGMNSARSTYDPVTGRDFAAPGGSAVVIDPNNGQVIALATVPDYNDSEFVGGISEANYQALLNDPDDPLLDRAIQGEYAPGSTFKLVTATAGLEYGVITPDTVFDDRGCIQVGTFTACNDNHAAYGYIQLPQAITVSSDNFFNTVGLELWYGRSTYGEDALQKVAEEYGFGSPTGIDIPGESSGFVPTPQSYVKFHQDNPKAYPQSQWYPGNSDQLAIGQDELLVTPLQLANAYAAFANGGTLYQPQLAMEAETAAGKVVKAYPAKAVRTISYQASWRSSMLAGFLGVVNTPGGTAYSDFAGTPLASRDIAGKTGTAQVNPPRQDTSVFVSFGPASNPQYVVDAFVEEAGYGASVAAPVVREIWDQLLGLPLQAAGYSAATGGGGQN